MEVYFKKKYEKFNTVYHKDYNDIKYKKVEVNDSLTTEDDIFNFVNVVTGQETGTEKHPYFSFLKTSNTEETFVKEFGNPMCSVNIDRLTLVVEGDETKVSIKLFQYSKHRPVGKPYFKKVSHVKFLTYKFDRNDLFYGNIVNGHKKKKFHSSVRRNYFGSNPICSFENAFNGCFSAYKKDYDESSKEIITNALKIFISRIPNFVSNLDNHNFDELFYYNFLKFRGIKVPNNYLVFRNTVPLPSKRILKKNGNKLLDSYMFNKGFKGDKIKKALHEVKLINDFFYKEVEKFFGEKFLKHQNINSIIKIFEFKSGYQIPGDIETLSDNEKKNAFKILELMLSNTNNIQTFIDHINFYIMLKEYEEIKWRSFDSLSFRKEHEEWTDRYSHYTKGYYTRFYDNDFVDGVQRHISNTNSVDYYPVVLLDSTQYNSESGRQNNCVKTYIDKASSLIISLREGSPESDERATIEYLISKTDDVFKLKRIQSLGRFNNRLDTKWDMVLEELDNRVNNLAKKSFKLPKVKVDFKNQSIESESVFVNNSSSWKTIDWVSPILNKGIRYVENNLF